MTISLEEEKKGKKKKNWKQGIGHIDVYLTFASPKNAHSLNTMLSHY